MELVTDIKSIDLKKLKKLMKDPKSAIELMHLFISQNFASTLAYEVAKRQLYAFANFCRSASYLPTPSILERILKENPLFSKTVARIVTINEKWITSGKLDDLFTDDIFIIIIESYCALNNIEIKEEEEEIICDDEDDGKVVDSDRMYLRKIRKKPLLNPEEERMYLKKAKEGDKEARNILVERNLGLAVKMAKRYKNRGLPFQDLVQEGSIGLMKAIEKFDLKKGCKFSTYATPWIRQAIKRAIMNTSRAIRYPNDVDADLWTYKKSKETIERKTGSDAKPTDIAIESGFSEKKVIEFERLIHMEDMGSLNFHVKDGESGDTDVELGETIPLEEASPEEEFLTQKYKQQLMNLINASCINEREKEIFLYTYPINGDKKKKKGEELAKMFGVSKQRINQIIASAMRHIFQSEEAFLFAQSLSDPEEAQEYLRRGRAFYANPKNYFKIFKGEVVLNENETKEEVMTHKKKPIS